MTEPTSTPAILLFLKSPVPGEVKTRLAKETGAEAACEIYCQLVEQQVAALPPGWPVEIHFAPAAAGGDFAAWLGPDFSFLPQPEGGLGTRLRAATAGAFERGHRKVILIGGDCPTLDAVTLRKTASLLAGGADVVIGPATDGGYYLLGLSRIVDSLFVFEEIPWSGPEVARVTADRATAAHLRVTWLEEKEDVDDLPAYRRALAAGHLKQRTVVGLDMPASRPLSPPTGAGSGGTH